MAPNTFTQRPKIQQRRLDERGRKLHIMLIRPWLSVCRLWILFHCQVCTSTLRSSSLTSMWDFLLLLMLHFLLSLKLSLTLFPLLSSQSALDSDFTFIQSVPLIGSLIFYCLHKDLWHQQGSAEDRPFFPSFHSVIHSFVLKGQVVWTLAVYETQCCDFTCLTKGLFIQFLTSI